MYKLQWSCERCSKGGNAYTCTTYMYIYAHAIQKDGPYVYQRLHIRVHKRVGVD